jgi:hypothetical protein
MGLLFLMGPAKKFPTSFLRKCAGIVKKGATRMVKELAGKSNLVMLRVLRNRYLRSFPERTAVENSIEYSNRVQDLLQIAREIVQYAHMDRDLQYLVLSLLKASHRKTPFVLNPRRIMNSRRVLKLVRTLITTAPSGRILGEVLDKMQRCIFTREAFPLQSQWAPNLRMNIAYKRDVYALDRRMRVMRELALAKEMWFAMAQVADEFGIPPDVLRDFASRI